MTHNSLRTWPRSVRESEHKRTVPSPISDKRNPADHECKTIFSFSSTATGPPHCTKTGGEIQTRVAIETAVAGRNSVIALDPNASEAAAEKGEARHGSSVV